VWICETSDESLLQSPEIRLGGQFDRPFVFCQCGDSVKTKVPQVSKCPIFRLFVNRSRAVLWLQNISCLHGHRYKFCIEERLSDVWVIPDMLSVCAETLCGPALQCRGAGCRLQEAEGGRDATALESGQLEEKRPGEEDVIS